MTMPTEPTAPVEPGADGAQNDPEGAQVEPGAEGQDGAEDGSDALRDAGKQALDRMKQERNRERARRRELEAELEKMRNPKPADGQQPDAEQIRREAEAAALKTANARILNAEVRAQAAGKLADPADALRLLDMSEFEVGADGSFNTQDIADAIDSLLEAKPYLSAQGGRRFKGSADGGARKTGKDGPSQLTKADVDRMTPEQINEALAEGRLANLGYGPTKK